MLLTSSAAGVHAPTVIAEDLARGFRLSDLGDRTYLAALTRVRAEALRRASVR
jgi:aminoglycoside/choline kinase family phosphotransferase